MYITYTSYMYNLEASLYIQYNSVLFRYGALYT